MTNEGNPSRIKTEQVARRLSSLGGLFIASELFLSGQVPFVSAETLRPSTRRMAVRFPDGFHLENIRLVDAALFQPRHRRRFTACN